ncbi:MAG: APC family permease [Dehalococcoidia bacterium]|nr:APC family permease [Dehalococcoidia bacterium]MSQ16038.1 APC family permease [Dehalococcoidia bacterium]
MFYTIRSFLIGNPLASWQARGERLGIPLAFVIVAANALSSSAYASEEILLSLTVGGTTLHADSLVITLAITVLMVLVVLSYDYVIRTYPNGGGAYVVAKENLGTGPGVVAGASLLLDYTLTVAVSVTAGAAAVTSAFPGLALFPGLAPLRVLLAGLLVIALTLINLRGVRQSAKFLALPVYLFLACFFLMLAVAAYKHITQGVLPAPAPGVVIMGTTVVGAFQLLRAFSSGCVAITGVEAISNTLNIFKPPQVRNARITLFTMGLLLAGLFLGLSFMAYAYHLRPEEGQTLVSQAARISFGNSALYYATQFSTLFILVVAANTSFSAFPPLAARLARDGFLPRPLTNLGDRLVFSNGILLLAGFASLLIFFFKGDVHRLLPLYAIGVFIGFVLTMAGMTRYWWRKRGPGWWHSFLVTGIGTVVTGVVLVVLTVTKFVSPGTWTGAWIVVAAIPVLLFVLAAIHRHYRTLAETLSLEHHVPSVTAPERVVIIPVGGVHRAVLPAVEYAQLIGKNVQAVHVAVDEDSARVVERRWDRLQTNIPLKIIPSPYREVVRPLVDYIQGVAKEHPSEHVTVVIPEFVPRHWWQGLLHNHTAMLLRGALGRQDRIILVTVPYHLPR